ncbi:TATA-box-binding protein-associated factor RNA polymerase i subunit b-like, partial [Plakobranchus ocellatus]
DVVYTLWANYLSKLGIAFCDKESIIPAVVEKYQTGRTRELFRGTLQMPSNIKKQPIHRSNSKKSSKRKRPVTETENDEEEVRDVDEPAEELLDPRMAIFLDTMTTSNRNLYTSARRKVKDSPEWMDIKKTIAFCYIGLMLTNSDILPVDVVRWAYEGKIPFLSTSHLLPEDMVLSNNDSLLFSVEHFTTVSLIHEMKKLRTYLNLTDIPQPDLNAVATRFIGDLCLPDEFCWFVKRLIKRIPFTWKSRKTSYKPVEIVAVGYIVLALKIIFGLDDKTENKLSDLSERLHAIFKLEPKLFIWSEWKKFWLSKQNHQFDAYQELTSDMSSSKLEHLDELLESYKKSNIANRRFSIKFNLTRTGRQVRGFDPEFRNALAKPLAAAITDSSLRGKGTCTSAENAFTEEYWRRKKTEFRGSTMCHVADFSLFQEKLESLEIDMTQSYAKLLHKVSKSQPKFFHYKLVHLQSKLTSERHTSYLWLLDLASKVCDCQVLALDKIVVRLADYFVMLAEGKSVKSLTCSMSGILGSHKEDANRQKQDEAESE